MSEIYYSGEDYIWFFTTNIVQCTVLFVFMYYYHFDVCSFPLIKL